MRSGCSPLQEHWLEGESTRDAHLDCLPGLLPGPPPTPWPPRASAPGPPCPSAAQPPLPPCPPGPPGALQSPNLQQVPASHCPGACAGLCAATGPDSDPSRPAAEASGATACSSAPSVDARGGHTCADTKGGLSAPAPAAGGEGLALGVFQEWGPPRGHVARRAQLRGSQLRGSPALSSCVASGGPASVVPSSQSRSADPSPHLETYTEHGLRGWPRAGGARQWGPGWPQPSLAGHPPMWGAEMAGK